MKNVGRKLYHLLGGLGLLALGLILDRPRAFSAYATLLAFVLLFDLARFALPRFNAWAMKNLASLLRPGEARKLNGTPPYILGVALTLLLFPRGIAVAAVLFLVVGDVAATMIGESWGKTKIGGKSLEGSAAFFAAALLAGCIARLWTQGPSATVLVAGGAAAALVELFLPRWANDNLVIPLAAAAVMALVQGAL